eukprot:8487558-Lingulodinium_polyedra.AAC.1
MEDEGVVRISYTDAELICTEAADRMLVLGDMDEVLLQMVDEMDEYGQGVGSEEELLAIAGAVRKLIRSHLLEAHGVREVGGLHPGGRGGKQ